MALNTANNQRNVAKLETIEKDRKRRQLSYRKWIRNYSPLAWPYHLLHKSTVRSEAKEPCTKEENPDEFLKLIKKILENRPDS